MNALPANRTLTRAVKITTTSTLRAEAFIKKPKWETKQKEEEIDLKNLIRKAIKYAPIVYPIVKKMLNKRKGRRTTY